MQRLLWLALAAMLVQQDAPRAIDIWSADPIAIDIDWITIDTAGTQTITARRKTVAGPPAPLTFVHGPDRFVRFSYEGASPRTFSTAELIAAKKLHVPDVLPGGELLLLIPRAPVRPVKLLVQGQRSLTVPIGAATHASLPGLPAGEYRIIPHYEGDISGETQRITVAAAATSVMAMPIEDVGAVRVSAPDHVCGASTEAGIDSLVYADVGVNFRTPPNRRTITRSKEPLCQMTFAGLKAGTFEAFYRSGRMALGSAEFSITPQTVTPVEIVPRSVLVEGRVTLNGRPMKGTNVSFTLSGKDRTGGVAQAQVTTDDAGNYRAMLERPGEYSIVPMAARIHSRMIRTVALVEGRNIHDIAFTGGKITVEVIGWRAGTPVQIRMEGRAPDAKSSSTSMSMFMSPPKEPIVFDAMPFGDYKIAVIAGRPPNTRATSRDMTNAKTVTLSASSPEATVTFDISRR